MGTEERTEEDRGSEEAIETWIEKADTSRRKRKGNVLSILKLFQEDFNN